MSVANLSSPGLSDLYCDKLHAIEIEADQIVQDRIYTDDIFPNISTAVTYNGGAIFPDLLNSQTDIKLLSLNGSNDVGYVNYQIPDQGVSTTDDVTFNSITCATYNGGINMPDLLNSQTDIKLMSLNVTDDVGYVNYQIPDQGVSTTDDVTFNSVTSPNFHGVSIFDNSVGVNGILGILPENTESAINMNNNIIYRTKYFQLFDYAAAYQGFSVTAFALTAGVLGKIGGFTDISVGTLGGISYDPTNTFFCAMGADGFYSVNFVMTFSAVPVTVDVVLIKNSVDIVYANQFTLTTTATQANKCCVCSQNIALLEGDYLEIYADPGMNSNVTLSNAFLNRIG